MRKLTGIISLCVIILSILISGVYAANLAKSGYWERVITTRNTGASSIVTRKTYWKGNKKRTEVYTIKGTIVEIKDGRTLYTYILSGKEAEKVVIPEKLSISVQQEMQANAAVPKNAKKTGTTSIKGYKCNIYKISASGAKMTLYMSTDSRFPLPIKSETTVGKAVEITDTKVLKLNTTVSDSLFVLPKGIKVTERKVKELPKQ
ncbi:MAG: DUF4412 domain-containing protein [Armatimonadota bacterium]